MRFGTGTFYLFLAKNLPFPSGRDTFYFPTKFPRDFFYSVSEYPLVTHDPNMLKNKSRGN